MSESKEQRVIKAAKVIRNYCRTMNCDDCVLTDFMRCDGEHASEPKEWWDYDYD